MLIESITLKAGSSSGQSPLVLDKPHFTVLIGPNNSGKSLLIHEIHQFLTNGQDNANLVLDQLKFSIPPVAFLETLKTTPSAGTNTNHGWRWYSVDGNEFQFADRQMNTAFENPNTPNSAHIYAQYYAKHKTLNLTGANRLTLLNGQSKGNLKKPISSFAKLFVDNKKRIQLRATIRDAFGFHIGLDVSEGANISMRFGGTPPPQNERSLDDDVLDWHSKAQSVEMVSDGVRAFTGILMELSAGNHTTFLIDEPEAFLHPALAFRLGKQIALSALNDKKQVFAATHSPQFLFGAIQSGVPVNIVRLTHSNGQATARLLSNDVIRTLMKDPLLRSSNVLAGLFHESVIVTEADSDRAFYQEINQRLLDEKDERGIDNPLFINGNGKDQLHRIVAPLRALGVPAAAIADIDVLNQGGKSWTNHLSAYGFPEQQCQTLGQQRATIWENLEKSGKPKKGLSSLEGSEKEFAENLLSQLSEYGFFLVPVGEVEHWLTNLNVSRSHHVWLKEIFDVMGDDPNTSNYIKPNSDPVWDFIGSTNSWLRKTNRKGIQK